MCWLWFAFNLLSLTYWKQHKNIRTWTTNRLWFAFNLLSLTYWKQLSFSLVTLYKSCDLLSIYYLWHTENNTIFFNIFHDLLWFAFNLLSLTYWKQPAFSTVSLIWRCDLLSIYYLWHTENNKHNEKYREYTVVICFQSIIFDILKTTMKTKYLTFYMLWFAFNLLSLTYWKQQLCSGASTDIVVICFQSIIFDILKTTV